MRYARLAQALFGETLALDRNYAARLVRRFIAMSAGEIEARGGDPMIANMREFRAAQKAMAGPANPAACAEDEDAPEPGKPLHVIGLSGPMLRRASFMDMICGGCSSMQVVTSMLREADLDPVCHSVAVDLDSPGGQFMGCLELGAAVADLATRKNVVALIDGAVAASAAFPVCAAAHRVVITPTSVLGSIGVYNIFEDDSEAIKKEGISRELFKSGKFKGMGIMPLTAEERADIQRGVDASGALFRDFVSKHRPEIALADMDGRSFQGAEAVAKGFADEVLTIPSAQWLAMLAADPSSVLKF